MELDCTVYNGKVCFEGIDDENAAYPIKISVNLVNIEYLDIWGQYSTRDYAQCIIFPKGKTTWEGFVPPCQFKDGDILVHTQNERLIISIYHNKVTESIIKTHCILWDKDEGLSVNKEICCYDDYVRLATEEEKQKLFQAIKDNGYKWNAEAKTLEKLVKSKFKVGDRIRSVISLSYYTIVDIKDDQYVIQPDEPEKFPYHIDFSLETNYELVHKFDITTLKPFESKVLVRDKNTDEWRGHFFSHYDSNSDRPYVCIGVEGINEYKRCIPYKDNEHLLGKTDDCSSFYKTWSND